MTDKPGQYSYRYPHPAVAADVVLLSPIGGELHVLLIRRRYDPFKGSWAFPGGFMEIGETLEHAAARELLEETGLRNMRLRQVGAFSKVDRDPRERVISVAFYGIITVAVDPRAADDAADVRWFPAGRAPSLAFDHPDILAEVIQQARLDLADPDIAREILPAGSNAGELASMIDRLV